MRGPEFLAEVPVPVCHLLGISVIVILMWCHRIEPDAGGAELDPGSASRSGRALIPRLRSAAGRAGLDP